MSSLRIPVIFSVTGAADDAWTPVKDAPFGFTGQLTAHKDNATSIEMRVVGEEDTILIPAEGHLEFESIDLSQIEFKGTDLVLICTGQR